MAAGPALASSSPAIFPNEAAPAFRGFREVGTTAKAISRNGIFAHLEGEGARATPLGTTDLTRAVLILLSCKPISYCRFERIDVYIL